MLVLTRKEGERLLIGDGICVTVVRIAGNVVRLGVEAPPKSAIMRSELVDRSNPSASKPPHNEADPANEAGPA